MRWQVRGSTTPCEEQAYILRHSRSSGLVIQDATSLQVQLPPPLFLACPSFTPFLSLLAELAAEFLQFLAHITFHQSHTCTPFQRFMHLKSFAEMVVEFR